MVYFKIHKPFDFPDIEINYISSISFHMSSKIYENRDYGVDLDLLTILY